MLLDRTDHNRFAAQLAERFTPKASAVALVPTASGAVTTTHNNPPSDEVETTDLVAIKQPVAKNEIDQAKEAFEELRGFLKETPVITNQAEAQLGAGYMERTRVALKAAREERETRTRPFLDKLTAIRGLYDLVREKSKTNEGGMLERAYTALRERMTIHADKVEAERIAEANRLRAIAEEQERIAREAAAAEQESLDNSAEGECTDVAAAIEEADTAFSTFQRAGRQAAIAERQVPMRLKSVLGGKSLSMRTTEVLEIEDLAKAMKVLGLTDKIRDAILSSAKDHRTAYGELPAGITQTFKRSM